MVISKTLSNGKMLMFHCDEYEHLSKVEEGFKRVAESKDGWAVDIEVKLPTWKIPEPKKTKEDEVVKIGVEDLK